MERNATQDSSRNMSNNANKAELKSPTTQILSSKKLTFWIEVPYMSQEEKDAHVPLTEPDRETPIRVLAEIIDEGETYYYARVMSKLIKRFSENFFNRNMQYKYLLTRFFEERKAGLLPPFDPSSRQIVSSGRLPQAKMIPQEVRLPRSRSTRSTDVSSKETESDDSWESENQFSQDSEKTRRRSSRKTTTKFGHFSPKKQSITTRSSTRTKRENTRYKGTITPGETDDDARSSISTTSDEDIEYEPPSKRSNVTRLKSRRLLPTAYGVIHSAEEGSDADSASMSLRRHREICEKCREPPAYGTKTKISKRKRKRSVKVSEDEFDVANNQGGWVRCLTCCVACHWGCLAASQRDDILRACWERAVAGEVMPTVRRRYLDVHETAEFRCSGCLRGGHCIGCGEMIQDGDQSHGGLLPVGLVNGKNSDLNDLLSAAHQVNFKADLKLPAISVLSLEEPEHPPQDLLFRCMGCKRPAHYHHLEDFAQKSRDDVIRVARHYQRTWLCLDCQRWEYPLDKIIAWRPMVSGIITSSATKSIHPTSPLAREYLVKWQRIGYKHLEWVPHHWLLHKYEPKLRHFLKKGTSVPLLVVNSNESLRTDMAKHNHQLINEYSGPEADPLAERRIPLAWKLVDRLLDVTFWKPEDSRKSKGKVLRKAPQGRAFSDNDCVSDDSQTRDEPVPIRGPVTEPDPEMVETANERELRLGRDLCDEDLKDMAWCFIKWDDLGYEEATWDSPPDALSDPEIMITRYKQAYAAFLAARNLEVPRRSSQQFARLDSRSVKDFVTFPQPDFGQKGKLMDFQLVGLTWLYRCWHNKQPAILADEMGLGKTVQIVSFLGMLIREDVYPVLVVVPNSTITNWIREFESWVPGIRAVQYNGEKNARRIIREYELYHQGTKDPKFHVLVTTYDTVTSVNELAVFSSVKRWECLIVDEGQRLKSDASLLFKRLKELRVMHRVLMTGTPLNNNIRELFNLMNFLDPREWQDLDNLAKEYDDLTEEKIAHLHTKLKPYFLRRVKTDVMQDMPPKNEVIVPISLAPLQKEVYKTLLSDNMDLLGTLAQTTNAHATHNSRKSNRNNLLMQLRKCMQHPYLVSPELEADNVSVGDTHRLLIESSGKLQFLKIMLPNLKERGHRVLLFSQFVIALDIIEDFLDGEGYKFLRLDGNTKQEMRQKDMDKFNQPGSDYFIYLLSTRAGGVGVNLWSADVVIIFDPDFNPHQDLQAIARAHRMGQTKKVLVFKLMIKGAAEERIIQAGKRKLVLDHLIVQTMDEEENDDIQTILSFGAKALFEGDNTNQITYGEHDVTVLLDRVEQEEPKGLIPSEGQSADVGMSFGFAKIWEAKNEDLAEVQETVDDTSGYWQERIRRANEEKALRQANEKTGRGVRRKATKHPIMIQDDPELGLESPEAEKGKKNRIKDDSDSQDWDDPRVHDSQSSNSSSYLDSRLSESELISPSANKQNKGPQFGASNQFSLPATIIEPSQSLSGSNISSPKFSAISTENAGELHACALCQGVHLLGDCSVRDNRELLKAAKRRLARSDEASQKKAEAIAAIDERLKDLDKERTRIKRAKATIQQSVTNKELAMHASIPSSDVFSYGTSLKRPPLGLPSPPSKKKPKPEIGCPICGKSPHHLIKNCPIVILGVESVKAALDSLNPATTDAMTMNSLRAIYRKMLSGNKTTEL